MDLELRRLSEEEIVEAMAELDGWSIVDGKLHREFVFADFVEAMGFMTRAAMWAEKRNHHPEWFNVYKTVRVELQTHDVEGLSPFDLDLAAKMNELAGQ